MSGLLSEWPFVGGLLSVGLLSKWPFVLEPRLISHYDELINNHYVMCRLCRL